MNQAAKAEPVVIFGGCRVGKTLRTAEIMKQFKDKKTLTLKPEHSTSPLILSTSPQSHPSTPLNSLT